MHREVQLQLKKWAQFDRLMNRIFQYKTKNLAVKKYR